MQLKFSVAVCKSAEAKQPRLLTETITASKIEMNRRPATPADSSPPARSRAASLVAVEQPVAWENVWPPPPPLVHKETNHLRAATEYIRSLFIIKTRRLHLLLWMHCCARPLVHFFHWFLPPNEAEHVRFRHRPPQRPTSDLCFCRSSSRNANPLISNRGHRQRLWMQPFICLGCSVNRVRRTSHWGSPPA